MTKNKTVLGNKVHCLSQSRSARRTAKYRCSATIVKGPWRPCNGNFL